MRHHVIIGSLVLLLAALPLAGCGDNDNGHGNDNQPGGTCGNGVVDQASEQCDGSDLDGATCASRGFSGGTLSCNASCRFVTTGCTNGGGGTPTPAVTPTTAGPTPTQVGPTATTVEPTATATTVTNPTATATPGGGPTCSGSESVVVTLSLNAAITSARLDTGYTASVNLPGSGQDQSVKDRVDFAGSGLTVVNDFDQSGDLVDDTLTTSLVGTDVLPAGTFATITFDCVAGQPVPAASDFTCTVVSASNAGTSVTPTCQVRVQ
jgi:hypothetical protein